MKLHFAVVICFQICIFVLGNTPYHLFWLIFHMLWFAFKFVFLYWVIHRQWSWTGYRFALWFAFKFVFLYWVIHQRLLVLLVLISCDLLSNLYFCIGWYTKSTPEVRPSRVVICFQICIFVLGDTPDRLCPFTVFRCDLLSNLYFCIGWYTNASCLSSIRSVVICFQICIFVLGDTPPYINYITLPTLWFAFKFVFLYWVIHLIVQYRLSVICCDLLSNLYFCIGWYTYILVFHFANFVVICFQICIFVLGDTPLRMSPRANASLWFAFKFVFLYWVIHPPLRFEKLPNGCDLLSNLYFCIGWYTHYRNRTLTSGVVICFQICIFVLGDTPF